MKIYVKVFVVGGGVVGCGIVLYLVCVGWDMMLVECDELIVGFIWYVVGFLLLFNMGYVISYIYDYLVKFYVGFEVEIGLNVGFICCGNLCMVQMQDWMDEYQFYFLIVEIVGVEYEFMIFLQIKECWFLVNIDGLKGVLFYLIDGYINFVDVMQVMVCVVCMVGVIIECRIQVNGYKWIGDEWIVICDRMVEKGGNFVFVNEFFEIWVEYVVIVIGNYVQCIVCLLGIKIFVILVEYQYIVIELDLVLVVWCVVGNFEYLVLCDVDVKWYVCEECGGWIFGFYECNVFVCFFYEVFEGFCVDLFFLDLEWIEEEYMLMIYWFLIFEIVGLKDDFNGLICYIFDGNLLVGFVLGLCNMWLVEGFFFGIIVVGGVGYYLVQMMI